MKKMALGILLTLAVLSVLASPATAASPSPGVPALSAFLSSLAAPAPVLAAKRPIIGKSLCSASANCGSGGTISCSGNNSTTSCSAADQNCSVGQRGFVTCDGVTTQCPNACPVDCDTLEQNCADSCNPCSIKTFQCSPYRCRCDFANCPQ
jgi:hypothetical protein